MNEQLKKTINSFWHSANGEDGEITPDDGYYYEDPDWDPCNPETWGDSVADPRYVLCEYDCEFDDQIPPNRHPCLVGFDCETNGKDNSKVCLNIFDNFCHTEGGETHLMGCPSVGPPCEYSPYGCGSDPDTGKKCFNCMLYADGNGGFTHPPSTPYNQQKRCDLIARGGGFDTPEKRACFIEFMASQGCGWEDEGCEFCEGLMKNRCEPYLEDCYRNNPTPSCENCFDHNQPNSLVCKEPIKCEDKEAIIEGFNSCSSLKYDRCISLSNCISNYPEYECDAMNAPGNQFWRNSDYCIRRLDMSPYDYIHGCGHWLETISAEEYTPVVNCCDEISIPPNGHCRLCRGDTRIGDGMCYHESVNPDPSTCNERAIATRYVDIPEWSFDPGCSYPGEYWESAIDEWCARGNDIIFDPPFNHSACERYKGQWHGCSEACLAARCRLRDLARTVTRFREVPYHSFSGKVPTTSEIVDTMTNVTEIDWRKLCVVSEPRSVRPVDQKGGFDGGLKPHPERNKNPKLETDTSNKQVDNLKSLKDLLKKIKNTKKEIL